VRRRAGVPEALLEEIVDGPAARLGAAGFGDGGRPADRGAAGAMRSVLGAEPGLGVLLGVTDSCWLAAAGIPALPAFGCGSLAVAHRPNEWIRSGDYATAIDLTEALVCRYTAP
jgi:acetylornithine deacetylase/succinyl-diaminopimelate desuccinylase-like protein